MRVVVVGAGAFGAWTAHHLHAAGARVILVDAYGPGNSKASSGDESRIIRRGYGSDEIYSRWAHDSLRQWVHVLGPLVSGGRPVFHGCGVLWLAGHDDYTAATAATLERCGYGVERLSPAELGRRFPQLSAGDLALGLFEPDCGVLMARRSVQTLVAYLEARGVRLVRGLAAEPTGGGRLDTLPTAGGEAIEGEAFVFACGPWLPRVFPRLLGGRIRPTRQAVVYLGTPAGDARFGPDRLPAWVDFPSGIYGIPDLEHRGVKLGIDRHGPPFDPDSDDRIVDAESVGVIRGWLARRMPALASAPVVESRVCQYENTDTGDFLIDRHPAYDNVWIAGGGSGHGFKHGPAIGAHVAGLVLGTAAPDARFALSSKGTTHRRSVF